MEIERMPDKLVHRELSEEETKELAASFQEKSPSADMNKKIITI